MKIKELADAFYTINWYNWDLNTMKSYMIAHQWISKRRTKVPMMSIVQGNFEQLKKVPKPLTFVSNCTKRYYYTFRWHNFGSVYLTSITPREKQCLDNHQL